jgi:transcriptional regulator with XRE-family HTH domain
MGETKGGPSRKKVGQSIKILRQQNGWSQEHIANRLGISIPALSKIETGVTDVNLSRLEQIAGVYGVTLSQLVNIYNEGDEPVVFNGNLLQKRLNEQELEINSLQRKVIQLYDELHGKK